MFECSRENREAKGLNKLSQQIICLMTKYKLDTKELYKELIINFTN